MSDFNYQEYLKNNPLLQEEAEENKLITESQEIEETVEETVEEVVKETTEEIQEEVPSSKMKVSELKAKIKEDILSILSEQDEEVDVDVEDEVEADVDVDVEDEVSVDAEGDDINITKKSVKADIEVGLSPEEELVQDSLEAAMKASQELGNDTLTDQIGNTITYFTRQFVVGSRTD